MSERASEAQLPQLEPLDAFNRELAAAVRPPDWRNPEPRGRYNLVVLGAGTAGLVAAVGAAGLGARVAIIERDLLGGDCLNVGCVPSKALIRCARAAAEARRAERFGVHASGVAVDFPAVMERMRRIRAALSPNDSAQRLRSLGIDVFLGRGRFTSADAIEVEGKRLSFARACIATGARASLPPIDGLPEAGCLTNETLFSLTQLPARVAVIGGGPIGCEMAQALARFGAKVSLIENADRVLGRENREASAIIERSLRSDGVEPWLSTRVVSVRKAATGKLLVLERAGAAAELVVDELVIGVGRAPNVENIGLEEAGVSYDARDGVKVDGHLRTQNPRIYAAGDVCLPTKFTHMADASARIVIRNALFFGRQTIESLIVPWCTYTDPEVAHVGMNEREAQERSIATRTFRVDLSEVDRARLDGEEEGFLEVHVERRNDQIVGATMVAAHAGETISEITAAMTAKIGLAKLAETIHCYPTQAEAIKKVADAFNRSRLTPAIKRVFQVVMATRR